MIRTITAGLMLSGALFGCGGGGGGQPAVVASTETFQIRTALTNYLSQPGSYTGSVSGTTNGKAVTGTFTVTDGNLGAATFESKPALTKATTATGNFIVDGVNVPSSITTTMYFDSNYVPLGTTGGDDYEVVTGNVTIPITGRVGDTGNLYTVTRYSSNTKTVIRGTVLVSYVIEPDTASTALFKLIEDERDTSNKSTSNSTISFRISPDGSIRRIQETLTETGTALTVTYTQL